MKVGGLLTSKVAMSAEPSRGMGMGGLTQVGATLFSISRGVVKAALAGGRGPDET